jgi:hypothetical protein
LQRININNISVEEQFAFRQATSIDKASYRLINEILNAMNERKVDGGIFCDLQKAFDCINHNILLTKLEFSGVTGTILKLILSYLEGRYQKVILDNNLPNSNSDWGEIRHDVPQGSTVGPLFFLTLWLESVSELYRPSDRCLLVKLVPTFGDIGCHMVSITYPYSRILGFF